MRKVISNTTPILSLLKNRQINILEELYDRVIIPLAVYEEIEQGKEKPYYQDLKQLDWIDIKLIKSEKVKRLLS